MNELESAHISLLSVVERQNSTLSALSDIAFMAGQTLDLDVFVNSALDKVIAALGTDAGWIQLLDEQENELTMVAYRGMRQAMIDEAFSLKVGQSLSGWVAASGEPLMVARAMDDARLAVETVREERVHNLACVPIKSQDQVLGTIGVFNRTAQPLMPQDVHFLGVVSSILAAFVNGVRFLLHEQSMRQEATALLSIAQVAGSTLELDQVLERIVKLVAELTHADRCSIWMLDRELEVLRPAAMHGMGEAFVSRWKSLPLQVEEEPLSQEALASGQHILVQDAETDPRTDKGAVRLFGDKSILVLPLLTEKKRPLGTLFVNYTRRHTFVSREIELVKQIAMQAAVAIENAQMYSSLRDRFVQEHASLLGLSGRFINTLDLQERLDAVVEIAANALHAEHCAIALLNDAQDALVIRGLYGGDLSFMGVEIPVEGSGGGYVVSRREPIVITDIHADARFEPDPLMLKRGVRSSLVVPLLVGDKVLGTLIVGSERIRTFDKTETHFCRLIANQTAIAVQNALLYVRERQVHGETEALYRVAQVLASTVDMDKVLQIVLQGVLAVTGLAHCQIVLCDPEQRQLQVVADNVLGDPPFHQVELTCDACPAIGPITERREPVEIPAEQLEISCLRSRDADMVLAVPIVTQTGVLGLICMDNAGRPHRFTARERRLAQALADQAALAIERARLYEERQREVEIKTVLLQELHHRVKNSLQMVAGFLSYQLAQVDQVSLQEVVEATMDRIKGIAVVHEALSHQRGERASVQMLVGAVVSAIPFPVSEGPRPQVSFSGDDLITSADRAITLTLILHELVSNAFRHGARPGKRLLVSIDLSMTESETQIRVENNGRALPSDFDLQDSRNLGLTVVDMLVRRDLEGQFVLGGDQEGVYAHIRFPRRSDDERGQGDPAWSGTAGGDGRGQ